MPPIAIDTFRLTNTHIRELLMRMHSSEEAYLVKPHDLENLFAEMIQAMECVRQLPKHLAPGTELEKTVSEYRSSVEQLRQVLPAMHARLIQEKARLKAARAHLAGAAAWVHASRSTL
jgi:hypothetical protein